MKNILLLVHQDRGQEARLQAALDLTRALGGHLACLDVTPYPLMAADTHFGSAEAVVVRDETESEARNRAFLSDRLAREDVSWSLTDTMGDMASALLDVADLADLIILNRALDDFPLPDMRGIVGRLVMRAHIPILAVPQTLQRFDIARALIAWDGRPAAAAALRATVPLLALAEEVQIFVAREADSGLDPEQAAAYLSRHGVHATVRIVDKAGAPADRLIAEESSAWRADYVVMGAYGHGRLRETFGGVTQHLLAESKCPLVLCH
ncbi:UspA domain-containing protein [Sphingopyxis fribergensis]|uniref:UspA domain-containing protein n=1 Tax=Sphingopyxis fribergensis TaxID=1515612 RepID=A0A0A7PJD8_9SPHN|nr:universal stress protein [Sphingopyxis fribergensis]AJA08057.1 UspA domain-containing protein [Sphingopyxis fribergensis]